MNIYFDHIQIMYLYKVFFRALHGLYPSICKNAKLGVECAFVKKLTL